MTLRPRDGSFWRVVDGQLLASSKRLFNLKAMSSPLSNVDPDLSSAEESGPGSEELSCSDEQGKGSVDLFDSSDEDIQGGLLKKKRRCFTPVAMSTRGDERSGHCLNYVSKSATTCSLETSS